MSGSQTHGFDVLYQISRERFLGNVLGTRLRLPEAFRAQLYQVEPLSVLGRTGFARFEAVNLAQVTRQDDNAFRLVVTAGQTSVDLRGTGLPLDDLLLRRDVAAQLGPSRVELALRFASPPPASLVTVTMDEAGHAVAFDQPALLVEALRVLNPLLSATQLGTLAGQITAEIQEEVLRKIRAVLFPLTVQRVGLPLPDPQLCNLAAHSLALKLLPAPAPPAFAVSFFLNLIPGRQGDLTRFTSSTLAAGEEVALTVGTPLLVRLICCSVPQMPQFAGVFPAAPSTTDTSCRFANGTLTVDGIVWSLDLSVGVAGDRIVIDANLATAGFGWRARGVFQGVVSLRLEGESVVPDLVVTRNEVHFELEWWVWLIAGVLALALFVVGLLTGGWMLGLILGGVTVLVEAILLLIAHAFGGLITGALRDALGALAGPLDRLQIVPADLTDAFGRLTPRALLLDDLRVAGLLRPPQPLPTVPGGQTTPSPPPPPPARFPNGAEFVSQAVPRAALFGEELFVSITLRNSGQSTWTPGGANPYRLGSQNPQDNTTWGLNRVALPATVAPGATVTFEFSATAPARIGLVPFQWRMVQEGVEWFGAATPAVSISVSRPRIDDL